jgi:hypothetical protein
VLGPGLKNIIPLIEEVDVLSTATRQMELPDEPENIDRVSEVAPPGKKLPFRIAHKGMEEAIFYVRDDYDAGSRTGEPFDSSSELENLKKVRFSQLPDSTQEAMKTDSLNAPITSEASAVFEWHLKADDDSIKKFIENVSPEAGRDRETEIRKRAEDMIAKILQEYLAPTTLGHAIEMAPVFNRYIKRELEYMVGEKKRPESEVEKPWGIQIGEAYLKPLYPGHSVNIARAEAAAAVSNKFTTLRNAEAEAGSIRTRAEAKAHETRVQADADKDKEIKKGEGEAGRIAAMAEVWKNNPHAKDIAELDVRERFAEAYQNNATVTTYAPGSDKMLTLGK